MTPSLPRPRPRRATPISRPAVVDERPVPARPPDEQTWVDDEAGPVVRPYVMTRGRVRPAGGIDLVAFVVTVPGARPRELGLTPEHRAILALTHRPLSVAEVSARLDLPLGVVRVLLGDLLADHLIDIHDPPPVDELPDEQLLEAVLEGLRAL